MGQKINGKFTQYSIKVIKKNSYWKCTAGVPSIEILMCLRNKITYISSHFCFRLFRILLFWSPPFRLSFSQSILPSFVKKSKLDCSFVIRNFICSECRTVLEKLESESSYLALVQKRFTSTAQKIEAELVIYCWG